MAKRPNPETYLDMRNLPNAGDPAGFMARVLAVLHKGKPLAERNAQYLEWVAANLPDDARFLTRDPVVLHAVGGAACNRPLRRKIVRYLLACEALEVEAERQHAERSKNGQG